MTPKRFKEEIREKEQDISNCQLNLKHCSDEKTRKSYEDLLKIYQNDKDEFVKKHSPKKKKVPIEYWKPESKGEIDESYFDKPYLSVSVQDTITKRPTKDSIRMYWSIKDDRCEYLVEEKGYVVGVIESVVIGVIQVSGWKIIKEGDNEGRVEFEGELLSDHPYLDYELKDRTVSGPIQYFNYPDDWTD
jgi:hypothetical protein